MKKIIDRFESPVEFWSLLLVLMISIYFFWGSFQFSDGDEIFPRLMSGATIVCTIVYSVKSLFQHTRHDENKTKRKNSSNVKQVIATGVLFILYLIIVWLFGFIIATVFLMIAYPIITGYKKPISIILLLLVNIGFVLLFQFLTGATLNKGLLINLSAMFNV